VIAHVPSLDQIAADPQSAACLPREVIAALLTRCLVAQSALTGQLVDVKPIEATTCRSEPLIDAVEMAHKLNVPQSWVRTEQRAGRIPCVKLGKYVRFRLNDVERVLAERQAKGRNP
jgi:hypothetical protein